MDTDCVSAIVPIKNGSNYIYESIPRILENLHRDDELIVVDDSSSDNSWDLVLEAAKSDPRLTLLRSPGIGIVDALNYGIEQAKFEKIARFDIDDIYIRDRIERQRRFLKAPVVAVFCDYNIVDSNLEFLGTIYSPVIPFATRFSLTQSQRTPHPGVIFSKSSFFAVGGYHQGEDGVEDLSLWLRLSKVGDLISIPEILFSYRLHPKSVTFAKRKEILMKKNQILKRYPLSQVELTEGRRQLSAAFSYYKSLPGSYPRMALLARELILLGSFKDRLLTMIQLMKSLFNVNIVKFLKSIYRIRLEATRRRKTRLI